MTIITTATTVLIALAVAVLVAAAVLTLIRLSRGPSSLDRIIASDTMVGIVIAALAIEAAIHDHGTTFPVMVVLSVIGFAGAVGMARFVGDRDHLKNRTQPSPTSGDPTEPAVSTEDAPGAATPGPGQGGPSEGEH